VSGHVEHSQRTVGHAIAIAVAHAEAGTAPGRVDPVGADVHQALGADPVVVDAIAAVDILEVVPVVATPKCASAPAEARSVVAPLPQTLSPSVNMVPVVDESSRCCCPG